MEQTIASLKTQYAQFKATNPKVRIRDAAKHLGVSEADLVATTPEHVALRPAFQEILQEIKTLGPVMALTRNDHAVHERKGVYTKASFNDHIGLVVNPDIDLRLFMSVWHFGFAVQEGDRRSLQFFDEDGEAVHKIYLTEQSDSAAYDKLITNYRSENQDRRLVTKTTSKTIEEKTDGDIDVVGFRQAWLNLKDTHHFLGLLRDFSVTRRQAMRLAPVGHTIQISTASLKRILEGVSERNLAVMVFIGNRGCIQIHTGPVKNLLQTGPWFNILDPDFNMHLREDGIESIWLVRKPTEDGIVTSLEAYDETGQVIVQFFGKRKPRIPEQDNWRQVVADYAIEI